MWCLTETPAHNEVTPLPRGILVAGQFGQSQFITTGLDEVFAVGCSGSSSSAFGSSRCSPSLGANLFDKGPGT